MRHSRNSKAYEALASFLKQKRHEKELSTRELAKRLGVHPSIVGKIETCMRKIDSVELITYCDALDIEPAEAISKAVAAMGKEKVF
jgi:transcriptional regulator with XRE-family HTH domain